MIFLPVILKFYTQSLRYKFRILIDCRLARFISRFIYQRRNRAKFCLVKFTSCYKFYAPLNFEILFCTNTASGKILSYK